MHTEFRQAVVSEEIRSLLLFDRKAFHEYPGDWFDQATWQTYESWWLIVAKGKLAAALLGSIPISKRIFTPIKIILIVADHSTSPAPASCRSSEAKALALY